MAGREHRMFRSLYPGKADCREGLMATLDYPTLYRLGWVDMERTVRML